MDLTSDWNSRSKDIFVEFLNSYSLLSCDNVFNNFAYTSPEIDNNVGDVSIADRFKNKHKGVYNEFNDFSNNNPFLVI